MNKQNDIVWGIFNNTNLTLFYNLVHLYSFTYHLQVISHGTIAYIGDPKNKLNILLRFQIVWFSDDGCGKFLHLKSGHFFWISDAIQK